MDRYFKVAQFVSAVLIFLCSLSLTVRGVVCLPCGAPGVVGCLAGIVMTPAGAGLVRLTYKELKDKTDIIRLTRTAVIEQRPEEFGKEVERQIAEPDIENQVATAETVSALKKMRADLKKNADSFESQRKSLKKAVMQPYEELYKIHIIGKFTAADELLKSRISGFEARVKAEKRAVPKDYFNRLQETYGYDFLRFEHCIAGEILLSTTEKKYREEIPGKFELTESDPNLIETQAYASEIPAEYKKTLNCSQAIIAVTQRKEAEKAEREQRANIIVKQRAGQLQDIGFVWSDGEQAYKN